MTDHPATDDALDVVVIGSTMVDLVTHVDRMPEDGETLAAPSFSIGFGGKGANQAVAAARLGAKVAFVGRVGDDDFGKSTLTNLRQEGIDVSRTQVTPGASNGVAPIFVDPHGRNRILIVKGANDHLTPEDVHAASHLIARARLIVVQLEILLDTVYAAIDRADQVGVPVLLNPAPADPKLAIEAVARCAYFVPNESELALLTNMPVDTLDEIRAAARTLLDRGLRAVIVTLGERGVLLLDANHDSHLPGLNVNAVDTSGAGDAFIGALARYLTAGEGLPHALAAANAYAADSVTRPGTQASYARPWPRECCTTVTVVVSDSDSGLSGHDGPARELPLFERR